MLPNPQFPADLVMFTKEIHNGKLYLFCSETGDRKCKLRSSVSKYKLVPVATVETKVGGMGKRIYQNAGILDSK